VSESNRFGIGAKVRVTSGGRTQLREVNPYGSYLSTSDVRLYFGLGNATDARIEIGALYGPPVRLLLHTQQPVDAGNVAAVFGAL